MNKVEPRARLACTAARPQWVKPHFIRLEAGRAELEIGEALDNSNKS
jgi:hypothetical protein